MIGVRNGALASWTAVAKRSGDTAFGRTSGVRTNYIFRAYESGVALRFPPHSKMRPDSPTTVESTEAVLERRWAFTWAKLQAASTV
jgi:hypothetical protein